MSFRDESDLEVVSRVLRGDRGAFRIIVDRYYGWVLQFARRFLGNEHDAEDAAQEVFVKVYRRLHRFSLEYRFRPWLYRVALNHFRTFYGTTMKLRSRECAIDEVGDLRRDTPPTAMIKQLQQEWVQELVNRLSPRLRQVVVLYYLQGLSVTETAQVLQVAPNTVKSALQRARNRLASMVAAGQDASDPQSNLNDA